jgi:predicted transcriptional regulator
MRTTVVIDDDVLKQIESIAEREKRSRRDVLNETLRRGIEARTASTTLRKQNPTAPQDLGRCLLPTLDDVSEALAWAEGEAFK